MLQHASPARPRRLLTRLVRAAWLGYWGLLFLATHVPLPEEVPIETSDKLLHLAGYGALAALWSLDVLLRRGTLVGQRRWMLIVLAVYAALDELLQMPVGRTADPLDWLADLAGVVLGMVMTGAAWRLLRRRRLVVSR